jgi:hypothetical protein
MSGCSCQGLVQPQIASSNSQSQNPGAQPAAKPADPIPVPNSNSPDVQQSQKKLRTRQSNTLQQQQSRQ